MIMIIALVAFIYHLTIEPQLEERRAVGLFVFLVLVPAAISGALIGKTIVNKYIKH